MTDVKRQFSAGGLSLLVHLAPIALLFAVRTAILPPQPKLQRAVTRLVEPLPPGSVAITAPQLAKNALVPAPSAAASPKPAVEPPPARIEVGGFNQTSGSPASTPGNAAAGDIVLGAWTTTTGPADRGAPPDGVVGPSGLFGPPAPQTGPKPPPSAKPAAEEPAVVLFLPEPAYTEEARRMRVSGEVVVEVRLAASGRPHFLRVVTGLGYGLDKAAEEAANRIQYQPARRGGIPIETIARVTFRFNLT
jgi:protein TonB